MLKLLEITVHRCFLSKLTELKIGKRISVFRCAELVETNKGLQCIDSGKTFTCIKFYTEIFWLQFWEWF